ncbi:nuclear factor 7, brain-like [Rhinophrynus dorsalis]
MASSALEDELKCSICWNLYRDPVMLRCGHCFCQVCIKKTWEHQEEGESSCPECRQRYKKKPDLKRSFKLGNIIDRYLSYQSKTANGVILCRYCIDAPVPAVKSCLHCETSLCERHLRVHSKSLSHVLTKPTTFVESGICAFHKKPIEYYCLEDGACICVFCCSVGEHREHNVEPLNEASEKKKGKLREVLNKLTSKIKETEKRVQILQEHKRIVKKQTAEVTEQVTTLFTNIKEHLEVLEKQILGEISRQEEQILLHVSGLIQQLENKKDEINTKISYTDELLNTTNPLVFLKESSEIINDNYHDNEENGDKHVPSYVDGLLLSTLIHSGLSKIGRFILEKEFKSIFTVLKSADLSLDVDTADNYIHVSNDLRTASACEAEIQRPDGPERFTTHQVLSTCNFSSSRHYWEAEVEKSGGWAIGVTYPSAERKYTGDTSYIGNNEKSWCLGWFDDDLTADHNSKSKNISADLPLQTVGIYLDYDAGRLSFYQLCDSFRHLHTFTATFTEPLYATFCVYNKGWVKIKT